MYAMTNGWKPYSGDYKIPVISEVSLEVYDDRDSYENDLRRRQREHLEKVRKNRPWKPCRHDGCSECCGTGIKHDGTTCIHMIHCDCPRCSPYFL